MHTPIQARKLGKLPPRHDYRTLHFANYAGGQLPPPPASCAWSGRVASWPMMLNDQLGDCAIAGPGHQIEAWTANAGAEFTPTDDQILAAYSAVSGYDPQTGTGDNGCVELDVLNYWRTTGIAGHTIGAFVALEPRSRQQIMEGVWLFGGIYIGLALPLSAQNQQVWSAPVAPWLAQMLPQYQPGSWGGHAVYVVDYDQHGLTCVTWGTLQRMTWAFLETYCEEAWGIVSQDWIDGAGQAPSGFDLAALTADLQAVTE
ncbi:MAG TPA: hypothetical protein VHY20_03995, partial [Pirellulales bacterium]|nr:hypothetical protein [Pirellulales bacterium]